MMLQRVKIAESDKKHIYEKIMMTKAIFNMRMGVVVIVSLIIFLFELIVNQHLLVIHNTMGQAQDTQSMVVNLFALSIYTLILGILPGIPYGFSLLEEKQSGYLRFKLLRMSPKRYIKNKNVVRSSYGSLFGDYAIYNYCCSATKIWRDNNIAKTYASAGNFSLGKSYVCMEW